MNDASRIPELLAAHLTVADLPPAWLAVSRGELSPEAAAAALRDHEDPALVERSKALFTPLAPAEELELRRRILAQVPGRVEQAATASHRRSAWIGTGLALAAGLVLAALLHRPDEPSHPALGARYHVATSAEYDHDRGPPAEARTEPIPSFRVDQRVDFTLKASQRVDADALEVRVLARDETGAQRWLGPPRLLPTTSGTVVLSERLDALGLRAGLWRLAFVVSRPGHPPPEDLGVDAGTTQASHFAVAGATIRVVDRPARDDRAPW